MSFLQQREINRTPVTGIERTTIDTECYYFHVPGHLYNNCPKLSVERCGNRGTGGRGYVGRTGTGMCHISVGLAHNDDVIIPSTWLLLDTCSTTSVGNNPDTLKKIRECLEEDILNIVTNGGNKEFNGIGEYELFPIK